MSAGAPSNERLLDSVRSALESGYGLSARGIRIVGEYDRVYSKTWRLKIEDGHRTLFCILKWMPFGAVREQELAAVERELFRNETWVQMPGIACNPTPETFLVEVLPGRPVRSLGIWPWSSRQPTERAGAWLKRFHAATATGEMVDGAGVLRYVQNRPKGLDALPGHLRSRLLERIQAIPPHGGVRVHGDFTPHNLLVADDGAIAVLDQAGIEEFDVGSPWFDVAWMVAGLERLWAVRSYNPLRRWMGPAQPAIRAFLESYGAGGDEPLLRTFRAARYFTVFHTEVSRAKRVPVILNWALRGLEAMLES